MRRFCIITLMSLMGGSYFSDAQDYSNSILGKWRTETQYASERHGWTETEYKSDGTFELSVVFSDSSIGHGVLVNFIVPMSGKYDLAGKSISLSFDEVGDLRMTFDYTPECTLSQSKRNELEKVVLDGFNQQSSNEKQSIQRQAQALINAGVYQQILMVNYKEMIIGGSARKPERFIRMLTDDQLAEATRKREEERAIRAQARQKIIAAEKADGNTSAK